MSRKSTLLSLLCCTKTSNFRKVYIAITFVSYTDIQCHESLLYYYFCIVQRHPMSGKYTLLSLLYYAQTSNAMKVYCTCTLLSLLHCVLVHSTLSRKSTLQSLLYCTQTSNAIGKSTLLSPLYCAKTSNVREVYVTNIFVCGKIYIQCQESLYFPITFVLP